MIYLGMTTALCELAHIKNGESDVIFSSAQRF